MTEKKFEAYVRVQDSGLINMRNIHKVIELADELCDVELTHEDCFDIMKNYSIYKYGGEKP